MLADNALQQKQNADAVATQRRENEMSELTALMERKQIPSKERESYLAMADTSGIETVMEAVKLRPDPVDLPNEVNKKKAKNKAEGKTGDGEVTDLEALASLGTTDALEFIEENEEAITAMAKSDLKKAMEI